MQIETRYTNARLEYRGGAGRKLTGYAALYNSESQDLGGFTEVIAAGAFRNILRSNPDVVLKFNHDSNFVLGRTTAGTLTLSEDERGLMATSELADTQLIRDMVISPMQRGEFTR